VEQAVRIAETAKESLLAGTDSPTGVDETIAGLAAGHLRAFERLFAEQGERMKSIAANLLGSRADAEDAVQEAFLKAYRAAGGFRGGALVSTWMYRILINTCYDHMRGRSRRAEAPLPARLDAAAAAEPDPPLRLAIEVELQRLPARERAAFLLCEVEGFSHREDQRDPGGARGHVADLPVPGQAAVAAGAARARRLRAGGGAVKAGCADLEAALESQAPERLAAVEEHAAGCPACARELAEWRRLSRAAAGLKKRWESPWLWSRIERALAAEPASARAEAAPGPRLLRWWRRFFPALAVAGLLLVGGAGLWLSRRAAAPVAEDWQTTQDPLLGALDGVEKAEKEYLASIDKLSALAGPRVASAASPLMLAYREKLVMLDAAIAELRSGVEQNRFNTHLRRELVAMYREKQETLVELMKEGR
jgi:RNA polymerase sigma-70 factor (ECF subfamily)